MTTPKRFQFHSTGLAVGIGVGAALCVSSGAAVGIGVGVALVVAFGFIGSRKC